MHSKPSFSVVAFVMFMLVVFGVTGRFLAPLVPETPQNGLAGESAAFLRQASTEQIAWHPFDSTILERARSEDRPILLVIGAPWSAYGRQIDKDTFTDGGVQEILARNFVCVRVDILESPEFRSAFLPLSRVNTNYLNGFQAWFLDSEGRLLDSYMSVGTFVGSDPRSFSVVATSAMARFSALRRGQKDAKPAGANQTADVAVMENGAEAGLPDYREHIAALAATLQNPKIINSGYRDPFPNAWRYLLLSGQTDLFKATIDPFLASPCVDVVDGGFFRAAKRVDWTEPEYDKVAVTNAELMHTLALGAVATGNSSYKAIAQRTFDTLVGSFVHGGLISACRIGDELPNLRSPRSSFAPRDLRDIFTDGEERDLVRRRLGLYVESNPEMVPRIVDPKLWIEQPEWLAKTLDKMRSAREDQEPTYTESGLLDCNGFVIARLIECARMWKDQPRLQQALTLVDRLDPFRSGDDVAHSLEGGVRSQPYLGDYLGYADACLQDYLATGRLVSYTNGERVLKRAVFLFGERMQGLFPMVTDTTRVPPGANTSEILDFAQESCTAQMVRLSQLYATITSGSDSSDFRHAAFSAVGAFSSTAKSFGPYVSGYYCAAALIQDGAYAVCVGPKAQELSDEVFAHVPTRLVSLAIGPNFPELQGKKPGVYIWRNGVTAGPLTAAEAINRLGFVLNLGQSIP